MGVIIGGARSEAVALARETVLLLGGTPQTRACVLGDTSSIDRVAFLNGIASHVLDFDDTHIPTVLHASGALFAAGLAVGEWLHARGRDLVAAHLVGFEVGARVALALGRAHYDVGWHVTGTAGTVGVAAAVGRLLGLGPDRMAHALGLAATQAAGHREQFGAMAKSFHAGRAASNGVLAALLAAQGFTAADDSLEGRRGLLAVMSAAPRPEALAEGLGERWEIDRNGVKPYACGVVAHPAIDAVLRFHERHGVRPEDVEAIELRVHPLVVELTGKWGPRSGLEGKFSVSYACAIALFEGAARERQFADEQVRRAEVLDLHRRIGREADRSLGQTEAWATARLRDGRTIVEHVVAASGTPENPLSDAEVERKLVDLSEPVLGAERTRRLIAQLEGIDDLDDVSSLVSATIAG
jgi:2-methylcitrate dehydratase PrpD